MKLVERIWQLFASEILINPVDLLRPTKAAANMPVRKFAAAFSPSIENIIMKCLDALAASDLLFI